MSKYRNRISEEDKIEVVNLYQNGLTASIIAEQIGVSKTAILKLLQKNGVERRIWTGFEKKYSCNENFFEVIDTEEKAYWLGFISADGYIHSRDKAVVICLQRRDREHLQKFLISLSSDYPIFDGMAYSFTNSYCPNSKVAVSSGKLLNDLFELGVHTKKFHTIKPCKNIPDYLLKDYWRGWIDGDGSIGNQRIRLTTNENCTKGFESFVKSEIETKATSHKAKTTWEFEVHGKFSLELAKLLYKDSKIYLDRKYEKAKSLWEV